MLFRIGRCVVVLSSFLFAGVGCGEPEVEESYNPALSKEQQQQASQMDQHLQNLIQNQVQPTMDPSAGTEPPSGTSSAP